MRVMVFVKATPESEAGVLPTRADFEAMGAFNQRLRDAGILVAADGLKPSSAARRVHFSGQDRTVTDGPFTETKEIVAGFWIWDVRDMDEAVAWVRQCPNPMPGPCEIDIRPFYAAEDFVELA